jgi:hypothetical protein
MFKLFTEDEIDVTKEDYADVKSAIDAEEDFCYNLLESGVEPPQVLICEVDGKGNILDIVKLIV